MKIKHMVKRFQPNAEMNSMSGLSVCDGALSWSKINGGVPIDILVILNIEHTLKKLIVVGNVQH